MFGRRQAARLAVSRSGHDRRTEEPLATFLTSFSPLYMLIIRPLHSMHASSALTVTQSHTHFCENFLRLVHE